MVAPSFATYEMVVAEPYLKNGKLYVTVRHPNTGNERAVRWYDEKEYTKAYGAPKQAAANGFDGLRQARGFRDGPIVVVRGNKVSDEAYFAASIARYATDIGWYFTSTDPFPEDRPAHCTYVLLGWDEFHDGTERSAKSPNDLKLLISNKVKNRRDVLA